MPSEGDLVLRLLLAAALAGALGVERELTEQPAGFRTHILVGLGAALFAIVSAYGFQPIAGLGPRSVQVDISRVASQIVVGIGFLGGGAIIKYGASIRGLTTAASLWVTAAIGTAIGVGSLALGSATTGITLVALVGLRPLRSQLHRYAIGREDFLIDADPDLDVRGLLDAVRGRGVAVQETRVTEDGNNLVIHLSVKLDRGVRASDVGARIAGFEHIRNVDWSQ